MIHSTPWPFICLIFGTSDLLCPIIFIYSHGYTLNQVIISIPYLESDSSILLSDDYLGLFSLYVSLLFIVLLGDLQTCLLYPVTFSSVHSLSRV